MYMKTTEKLKVTKLNQKIIKFNFVDLFEKLYVNNLYYVKFIKQK